MSVDTVVTLRAMNTEQEDELDEYNVVAINVGASTIELAPTEQGKELPVPTTQEQEWRIDAVHDWLTLKNLKGSVLPADP